MLKPYQFLLTISFLLTTISGFGFEVENQSNQDSTEIKKLVDYLIKEEILKPNEKQRLVISNFGTGNYPIRINISEYYPPEAYHFSNDLEFGFYESDTKILDGFIIANHILINAQNYFFYKKGYQDRNAGIEDLFKNHISTILKKNFADTLILDTMSNYITNRNGKIIGDFKLEFKTLAFHGCMFSSEYSLIEKNSYLEFKFDSIDFEPVFVLYTDAPKEFNTKKFYGTEFYMFDINNTLIHKGIISEAGIGVSSE